jgi:hypothetical protein
MKRAIPQENTLFRLKLQPMSIIKTKIWPTDASKDAKKIIVGWLFKHTMIGSIFLNDTTRHAVNQISCS